MPRGRERGERRVIKLTRINGDSVTVNSDLIMFVEAAGETTITLSNGERMKVREDVERLCDLVLEFKRAVFGGSIAVDEREYAS
jgi:flagellar protein FlbD